MPTIYEQTLKEIRQWPPVERAALIRALLQPADQPPVAPTLSHALGIVATNQPPPSDGEIAALLEARRAERFEV